MGRARARKNLKKISNTTPQAATFFSLDLANKEPPQNQPLADFCSKSDKLQHFFHRTSQIKSLPKISASTDFAEISGGTDFKISGGTDFGQRSLAFSTNHIA